MCGILAYFKNNVDESWKDECHKRAKTLKPRGPDKYKYIFLFLLSWSLIVVKALF